MRPRIGQAGAAHCLHACRDRLLFGDRHFAVRHAAGPPGPISCCLHHKSALATRRRSAGNGQLLRGRSRDLWIAAALRSPLVARGLSADHAGVVPQPGDTRPRRPGQRASEAPVGTRSQDGAGVHPPPGRGRASRSVAPKILAMIATALHAGSVRRAATAASFTIWSSATCTLYRRPSHAPPRPTQEPPP
jgi:hypothetical protein